jgi:hypothetical protein
MHHFFRQRHPSGLGGVHLSTLAFVCLVALFVLPWILLAIRPHHHHEVDETGVGNAVVDAGQEVRSGSFGKLVLTPIVISPVDRALPPGWSRPAPATWFFPGYDAQKMDDLIASLEIDDMLRHALADREHWSVAGEGLQIKPSVETIFALPPGARDTLYQILSRDPRNQAYRHPWSLETSNFESSLTDAALTRETRDLIRRVAYTNQSRVFVSDVNAVVSSIEDESEKLRAVRFLKSASTYLVQLSFNEASDIDTLISYWARHRSVHETRPILESLDITSASIDITHVLAPFARRRIYTYPDPQAADDGVRRDCHWSSLNFFAVNPDDQLGNTAFVQEYVLEHYYQTSDEPVYGDIIFFTTPDGQTVHSAVYLAAGLAFTKNGDNEHQPWIIMDLDDIRDLYTAFSHAPTNPQTWRRKGGA